MPTGTGNPLQVTIGAPDPCAWDFDKWIAHGEQPTVTQRMQKALCELENPTPDLQWVEGVVGAGLIGLMFPELAFIALPLAGVLGLAFIADKGVVAATDAAKQALSNPLVLGGAALAAGWYLAPAGFLVGAAASRRRRRRRA